MAGISLRQRWRSTTATSHGTVRKWRNFAQSMRKVWPTRFQTLQSENAEASILPRVPQNVSNTKSKKKLILEYRQTHGLDRVGARELHAVEADLRQRLGPDHKTSISYIANVLREAGARVEFSDRFVDPVIPERYTNRLDGLLHFQNLEETEAALREFDAAYREYHAAADQVGTGLVRSLVVKGRLRAESLAANPKVGMEKRREKKEIARWFAVWLELPDSFFDWLELRKRSDEFQRMFAKQDGAKSSATETGPDVNGRDT